MTRCERKSHAEKFEIFAPGHLQTIKSLRIKTQDQNKQTAFRKGIKAFSQLTPDFSRKASSLQVDWSLGSRLGYLVSRVFDDGLADTFR